MRWPQARHATKLEKPRRLSSSMLCSPFSRRSVDGVHQRARKGGLLARFEKLLAHVDQLDLGHGPPLDALRQFEQRVLAALGVVAGFETGRGRAQHDAPPPPRERASPPHRGRGSAASPAACSCDRALRRRPSAPDSAPARTRRTASPPPRPRCPGGCAAIVGRARHRETRSAEWRRARRSGGGTARPPRASGRSRAPASARCGPARETRRWRSDRLRSCPNR